ncbi:ArsR/SmtB family transcription factor [Thermotalea metallivorans]|uniref:Transcriptional repressor SdpR n=1 Tax=Thermotalea metallivorans TaxID=520762 RepID=A0A140L6H1_9FIRM|nr:metalloregulator ArsR/SmtB family transcription factor [Thermotalea metallivorans]KXG76146.1 Transcriptional repressor SdpR [Thermotalea metallivorans]
MKEQIEIFKALSDENRIKILKMLSCRELCACDIQQNLDLTQPTISHHMKVLQQTGLIQWEKRGKWIFYRINQKKVEGLYGFIKEITNPSEDCPCPISSCDCDGFRR